MTTVTIQGHVWDYHFGNANAPITEDPKRFAIMAQGPNSEPVAYRSYVGPIELQYEVPAGYNPTRSALEQLEQEKAAVRAAYLAKVREIEERISKLQALDFNAGEVEA